TSRTRAPSSGPRSTRGVSCPSRARITSSPSTGRPTAPPGSSARGPTSTCDRSAPVGAALRGVRRLRRRLLAAEVHVLLRRGELLGVEHLAREREYEIGRAHV